MAGPQAALRDVTVTTSAGEPYRLAGLWSDRPAVLVLLRHFG